MQELLNIRFSYLLRSTHKNKDDKHPIILRVRFRSQIRDIFTGLYCQKMHWDKVTNKVKKANKQYIGINQNLDLILRKVNNVFDEMRFSGRDFTIDELVDKMKGNDERPTLLIDFLEEGNRKMAKRVGVDMLKVTYVKYERSIKFMKTFLEKEFKVKNFSINRINTDFIERYFQFLRTERKIAHNTASKYVSYIRTSLDFEMVYYVLTADYNVYMDIQQAINMAVYEKFEREHIEFAYPTRKIIVSGNDENNGNKVPDTVFG